MFNLQSEVIQKTKKESRIVQKKITPKILFQLKRIPDGHVQIGAINLAAVEIRKFGSRPCKKKSRNAGANGANTGECCATHATVIFAIRLATLPQTTRREPRQFASCKTCTKNMLQCFPVGASQDRTGFFASMSFGPLKKNRHMPGLEGRGFEENTRTFFPGGCQAPGSQMRNDQNVEVFEEG